MAETRIRRGTPAFRATSLALLSAGFATFGLLYSAQALLPVFSASFGISAATSSLSLSLTTGILSVALVVAGAASERFGRKPLMLLALTSSAGLSLLSSLAPDWHSFLLLRALMGLSLAGLPAVAMAYISEEMDSGAIGLAMGLYVAGNALGGMSGRLLAGAISDFFSWRWAVAGLSVIGLGASFLFWQALPGSRHFQPRGLSLTGLMASYRQHLRDAALPWLFLLSFLISGGFVTVYNYTGYRLREAPFLMSQGRIGLLFSVYLVGIVASPLVGDLANRLGRRRVLWGMLAIMLLGVWLTGAHSVLGVLAGVAVLTFGFFGAHSTASAWVATRARQGRAQASSLYLFSFYLGSSVVGWLGGLAWGGGGWAGVQLLTGGLVALGLAVSVRLGFVRPLPAG